MPNTNYNEIWNILKTIVELIFIDIPIRLTIVKTLQELRKLPFTSYLEGQVWMSILSILTFLSVLSVLSVLCVLSFLSVLSILSVLMTMATLMAMIVLANMMTKLTLPTILTMLTMWTALTRKPPPLLWKKDVAHPEEAKQSNCQTALPPKTLSGGYLTRCARIAASIAVNDESSVSPSSI